MTIQTSIGMITPWVSAFSLLWFAAGILVGREMPRQKKAGGRGGRTRRGGRGGQTARKKPAPQAKRTARSNGNRDATELYVGNLPYDTSDKDVRKAFERFGRVVSVRLIENRQSGKPKGFGFVEMADERKADAAISAMNGADFQGRALVVNAAKSKSRDD